MSWPVALFLRVLLGYGFCAVLIKILARRENRTAVFLWQFFFAFVSACALLVYYKPAFDGLFFIPIVVLGIFNTIGTFFQWKAVAISQSRNALFTFWDDIIAVALSWIFLHEGRYLTWLSGLGIVLSFAALAFSLQRSWKNVGAYRLPLQFYWYVSFYSVVWGVAYFCQRLWAYKDLSPAIFICAWYCGAVITAFFIHVFSKAESSLFIRPIDWILCFVLGVSLNASLYFGILAFKAPQIVVQPILFVSEMILPAIIGLFLFHERKQFDRIEWFYFGLGFIGALLVGLGFHS